MKNMYQRKSGKGLFNCLCLVLGLCLFLQQTAFAQVTKLEEGQAFEVLENTPIGTVIGTVNTQSTPADGAQFSIVGGTGEGFFCINSSTAELSVCGSLNYESSASYVLIVKLEENGLSDEAEVVIDLIDVVAPTLATGNAVGITEKGASIAGTVNPNGFPGAAAIQYGTEARLDQNFDPETAEGAVHLTGSEGETTLKSLLSGLEAGTTYYYRTAAKNSEGAVFGATESFTTLTIPVVESIIIRDSNPTNSEVVSFLVNFSEVVNNVDIEDFELELIPVTDGTLVGTISEVASSGTSGREFIVTVGDVRGDGTLKLIFLDNGSVNSVNGVKVGGEGVGNGTFEEGEIYTIDQTNPGAFTLLYTNEDVSVRHFFAVTNNPDNPEDLTVSFTSSDPDVIGENSYQITKKGGRWEIRMFPVEHAHGETTITITVIDGVGNQSPPITLMVVVRAVADAPILVANNVTGEEDTDIPLDVSVNLVDTDGSEDLEEIKITGVPAGASLSAGISNGLGTYTFASAADLETVKFIPENNAFGVYELTLHATSRENEEEEDLVSKEAVSISKTFTVTITPVNDEPKFVLSESVIIRDEDFTDTVKVTATLVDVPADEVDQEVTYSLSPAASSVTFAQVEFNEKTGEITIKAVLNQHGSQSFVVTATDEDGASYDQPFSLTVRPVNDPPKFVLSESAIIRDEDFTDVVKVAAAMVDLPANEVDQEVSYSLSPAAATITFVQLSFNEETGEIIIQSEPGRYGSQSFVVTATDEDGASYDQPFSLTVTAINDAPEFTLYPEQIVVEEDFTTTENVVPTLKIPFSWGEEDEVVTFSLRNADIDFANISINPVTGVVTITSVPNKNGEQMISLVATDNGSPAPAEFVQEFLLRVVPVPDQPVLAGSLDDQTINEDEAYAYTIPAGIFTDPDGDETLVFSATLVGGAALPEWLSFSAATKTFSGTPDGPDVGEYMLEIEATDPTGTTIKDGFKLTVTSVNDLPLISAIDDINLLLGESIPVAYEVQFTVSDEETPAADLQITIASDNHNFLPLSAISLLGEGENRKLILSPPALEMHGSATITITVSDGEGEGEESFLFTVEFQELAADIPDLITPNGDNANDTWNIRWLSLYETNQLRVFDRYGRLVFEAKDYHKGREWDGTQGGKDLPEGVYLYELVLNNGEFRKQGILTIAR